MMRYQNIAVVIRVANMETREGGMSYGSVDSWVVEKGRRLFYSLYDELISITDVA